MHYNINYKDLTGQEKISAALKDVRQYFGNDKEFYDIMYMISEYVQQGMTLGQLAFELDFAGVQGYPVRAIYYVAAHC